MTHITPTEATRYEAANASGKCFISYKQAAQLAAIVYESFTQSASAAQTRQAIGRAVQALRAHEQPKTGLLPVQESLSVPACQAVSLNSAATPLAPQAAHSNHPSRTELTPTHPRPSFSHRFSRLYLALFK